ncbi:MAG: hypothetical protein KTR14_04800 [Vampirovibrio sp.]|nr:hypothetical protein [Vampirovibrio sp.]
MAKNTLPFLLLGLVILALSLFGYFRIQQYYRVDNVTTPMDVDSMAQNSGMDSVGDNLARVAGHDNELEENLADSDLAVDDEAKKLAGQPDDEAATAMMALKVKENQAPVPPPAEKTPAEQSADETKKKALAFYTAPTPGGKENPVWTVGITVPPGNGGVVHIDDAPAYWMQNVQVLAKDATKPTTARNLKRIGAVWGKQGETLKLPASDKYMTYYLRAEHKKQKQGTKGGRKKWLQSRLKQEVAERPASCAIDGFNSEKCVKLRLSADDLNDLDFNDMKISVLVDTGAIEAGDGSSKAPSPGIQQSKQPSGGYPR